MATIILTKHGSGRLLYRKLDWDKMKFSDEYKSFIVLDINGVYFDDVFPIISILSIENKNYLLIDKKKYELDNEISIKYYSEQNIEESSWIKILKKEELIFNVTYKNNAESQLDYIGGGLGEDYDVMNPCWHIANYINRANRHSDILFPSNV